jgi:HSP20 family protein
MSLGALISRPRVRSVLWPARDADRLFDEFWSGFDLLPSAFLAEERARFAPRIDVAETDEEYRVTADLPGLEEKDFEVVLDGDVLTLKGERHSAHESVEEGSCRIERVSGKFERRLAFETPIDADKVTASYKNGVLTVQLPKPAEARPKVRTIPIKAS